MDHPIESTDYLRIEGLLPSGMWVELLKTEAELPDGVSSQFVCEEAVAGCTEPGLTGLKFSTTNWAIHFRPAEFVAFRATMVTEFS